MIPDRSEAIAHLTAADPLFAGLIERTGPCAMEIEEVAPFQALVEAVAHQQLHGRAARTILGRFRGLFPDGIFPIPAQLAGVDDEALRGVGFSRAKAAAIRDLAAKSLTGIVPALEEIRGLPDEEIIARLTRVRGVGRWTVEMMLISTLGRTDVWPVDDFGVRAGWRNAFGLAEMPKPRELLKLGDTLRPHRSTAAWYLWRSAEAGPLIAR